MTNHFHITSLFAPCTRQRQLQRTLDAATVLRCRHLLADRQDLTYDLTSPTQV